MAAGHARMGEGIRTTVRAARGIMGRENKSE